jgi:hypothetical protein
MWRLRQQRWLLLQLLLLYRLDVEWCGRQAAWGRRADAAGAAAAKSCARKRSNNECKRRQFSMHVLFAGSRHSYHRHKKLSLSDKPGNMSWQTGTIIHLQLYASMCAAHTASCCPAYHHWQAT